MVFKINIESTEIQKDFEKFLDIASEQEIIITRNGIPAARLIGTEIANLYLSELLVSKKANGLEQD